VFIGNFDSWRGHNGIAGGPGEDRIPDPMVANPAQEVYLIDYAARLATENLAKTPSEHSSGTQMAYIPDYPAKGVFRVKSHLGCQETHEDSFGAKGKPILLHG
jgi:hypothetical protein